MSSDQPITAIPYATPAFLQPHGEIWREGGEIVVPNEASFPPRCVKCNAPAEYRWKRKLSWHPPGWYVLILFPGLIFYVLVAILVRRSATVNPALCDAHRVKRRNAILIAWLLVLGGVASFIAAAVAAGERSLRNGMAPALLVILGIVAVIAGLIFGMVRASILSPSRIDRDVARYRGAGQAFLASLG